ncbi:FAD-dependent monooxygenase [Nostoc sp. DSM 114160]|jgi:2-polyprenyl-6-methoxyphenol hydroxylase-like FAD-dependent oxidoreductase
MKILTTKKIILIGGGIGGTATALALYRAGFEPIVYERTATLREVGAGVALWANATHVLKELGVLDDVLRQSNPITNYQFFSQMGKELMNLCINHFEVPALAIHRADLLSLLWRKLSSEHFVLGQTFERFELVGNKVRAYFTAGLADEGDVLIGADGLRSKVRSQLFGQVKPIYRGMTSYRGLTNYIPNTYKPGYICEFLGSGKAFGFVTIGKGRMYWYVASKAAEGQSDAPVGRKQELQEMFQDWPTPIPELIAATDETSILKTDLYDRVPIPKWSFSNITLLGDAAHPTLPTMGQGACMAIEDALVVTQCLLEHSDPAAALRQYESRRLVRTKKIVEQSLLIGKVAQLENPVVVAVRNTLMKLLSQQFDNDYRAIHAYRVSLKLDKY